MADKYNYTIMKKESLADSIYLMDIKAPRVSRHCYPGQFIIVKRGKESH